MIVRSGAMKRRSKLAAKIVLAIILAAQFYGASFLSPKELESANLTSVSDTLSNNRLSFRGSLNGAVAAGSGVIEINSSPTLPYTSSGSASLMGNENVKVGTNVPIAVKTIDTATRVTLASGLTTAAASGQPIIATVSATHTLKFTPASAITNGAFRVLVQGYRTDGGYSNYDSGDGLPDPNGFDCTNGTNCNSITVTCSGGGSGFTFQTGTATSAATANISVGNTYFHAFECRYYGGTAPSSEVTMIIGTAAGTKIINPSPASTTRNPGQADTYNFRARHLYGTVQSYATADESIGTIGVVEAVRVTATVAPILTFTVTGVAASISTCGQTTDVATTVNSVPLGTLTTSSFTDAAQLLTVSTNAAGGYSVTASESAALTAWNITGTPTIPDTTCAVSPCTVTTTADWTSTTYKGFGYALHDINATNDAVTDSLEYNTGGTYKARPFGLTAEQIMRANPAGPVDADQAYVCYKAIVSGTQQAGDYENYVIYIATATF
jgi:hypothetical protein